MNDQRDPHDTWPFGTPASSPSHEPTRILPPPSQTPSGDTTSERSRPRRAGTLTAGVLAGALLVGGGAGIGGAAWYDAWQGTPTVSSDSGTSSSDSGGVINANNANLPGESVEKVANKVLPSVVKINVSGNSGSGTGSGIVLTSDGQILTNNHVVDLGSDPQVTVNFNDGKTVRAKVLGTDPITDLAVIKAEGVSGLTAATIGKSGALRVGQSVVAIGSPYGLDATVTTGIVSALHRPVSVQSGQQEMPSDPFGSPSQPQQQGADLSTTYPAIQTDAAINPGNSGGPLVDMAGRVVGINSSIRTANSGDSGSIGLGFSIPIDEVLPVINQIAAGEKPTHARLGVSVSDVQSNSLQTGAVIADLDASGAAADAGLKQGDIITRVGDQTITSSESLVATVRGHRPDDTVTITYVRDGKTARKSVKLGSDAQTKTS